MALSAFRRAIDISQQAGCLNHAAQAALTMCQEMGDRLATVEKRNLVPGRKLSEEMQSLEHEIIKHSLEAAGGRVTLAARNLGISYQALNYLLETRHKDLLNLRTPVRRRPRQK